MSFNIRFGLLVLSMLYACVALGQQPANDNCEDALLIGLGEYQDCGAEQILASTLEATFQEPLGECIEGLSEEQLDIWFRFNEGNETELILSINHITTDILAVEFFTACGTPATELSQTCFGHFGDDILVTGFNGAGNDYLMRISSIPGVTESGEFELCVTKSEVPENDLCENAMVVACGDIVTGSNLTATPSGKETCAEVETNGKGVWFQFEGTGNLVEFASCGSDMPTQMAIYSGSCTNPICVDAGNEFSCGGFGQNGASVTIQTEVNETYFIYLAGAVAPNGQNEVGTYELFVDCIEEATNETCDDALILELAELGECALNEVSGDFRLATMDGDFPDCAQGGGGETMRDVWYIFDSEGEEVLDFTFSRADNFPLIIEIWNSCGQIASDVDQNCFFENGAGTRVSGFDATGATYYIRVVASDFGFADFTRFTGCVSKLGPCPAAANFELVEVTQTTIEFNWQAYNEGSEFYFEYGAPGFEQGTGQLQGGITGTNGPSFTVSDLQSNTEYEIYFYEICSSGDTSTILGPGLFETLPFPPANDLCSDAINLPINAFEECANDPMGGTFVGANLEDNDVSCAPPFGERVDVWYSFNSGSETSIMFNIGELTGPVFVEIQNSCGILATNLSENCFVVQGGGGSYQIDGFTGNPTDYIFRLAPQVGGFQGGADTFTICLSTLPPVPTNDVCMNAISVACGNSYDGTTLGATFDEVPNCNNFNGDDGVWYSFEGNGDAWEISTCESDNISQLAIYTGDCNDLICDRFVFGGCPGGGPGGGGAETVINSVEGETYYVLVIGRANQGNFSISFNCLEPTCPNPTDLQVESVTSTSATINWVSENEGATYVLEYGFEGFQRGTGAVVQGIVGTDGPPANIDGLATDASYDVYLLEFCSFQDRTSAIGPLTFRTLAQRPNNDLCANAIDLSIGENCQGVRLSGSTVNALSESDKPSCLATNEIADVWYTFNTGNKNEVVIELSSAPSIGFALYNACNGNEVICVDSYSEPVVLTSLAVNFDYYLRVFTSLDATTSFDVCVTENNPTNINLSENKLELKLHPNPVSSALTVVVPQEALIHGRVEILTILGETVLNRQINGQEYIEIDVSDLPNGQYILQYTNQTGEVSRQFSIQH